MEPAYLNAGNFVGLRGAKGGLHDTVKDVPVKLRCPLLTLGPHVVGHEAPGQFRDRRGAAFNDLVVGGVMAMCYRPQNGLRAAPGALQSHFADSPDGIAPNRCASTCTSPIDNHIGLGTGRADADAE